MSVRALRRLSPWQPAETLRVAALAAVGAFVLLIAWIGAADEASLGGQIAWLNLATAGFVIASFGATSWLLRARVVLAQRRDALFGPLVEAAAAAAATPAAAGGRGVVVAHPGNGRFHRPGCQLAADRGWPETERDELEAQGRHPCGVCRP